MTKTPAYLVTLIGLYERGAANRAVALSTAELAADLGLSQQAVSKHLIQLESQGMVERSRSGRKTGALVTKKGSDTVLSFYSRLKGAVEGRSPSLEFRGTVFTGLGEGAYYIALPGYRSQFAKVLGFEPYPGTLNLVLDQSQLGLRKQLNFIDGLQVSGFKDGGRTYGPVKCFKAAIESKYEAGALVIERTHHGDAVLEIVSPIELRKALSLRDGDSVRVSVFPP
jgi:riboflavin kinase, archaea type